MTNLTKQQIVEQIDWERRETNDDFASPSQITSLMNKCVRDIVRTPGVRTVKETTTITFTGTGEYTLPADFKSPIVIFCGVPGSGNQVEFQYTPADEIRFAAWLYGYSFISKNKIYLFATNDSVLPSTTITIDYWSTNIILDTDGVTKKGSWSKDGDTSRLQGEYDDLYIEYSISKIFRRDGDKEWKDRFAIYQNILDSLKVEGGQPKPTRPRREFGHYYRN